MAKESVLAGTTSHSVNICIYDSSSTVGAGLSGLVFNTSGLVASYTFTGANATRTAVTLATLAAINSAFSSGGFKEIDATNMKGGYRLDIPNAALAAASGQTVTFELHGATNMAPCWFEIELTATNNQDGVRGGMTALPNAAAAAAGGLIILGSNNTAAITVGALTTGAVSLTTLTASGAVAFQSTFAVTTSTALGALSCTTLTASGAVALQSTVGITGAVTLSSTLGVGSTTLNALTVTNATTLSGAVSLGSTFAVTGATTFAAVNTGNITTTGNWAVSGTVTLTGAVTANNAGNAITGVTASVTGSVTVGTNNDKAGYGLTAAYDLSKTAAQAGDAMALTGSERTTLAGVIWATVITGTTTAIQAMRGFIAAMLGKASGLETTTAKYRNIADSKDVIAATVDADGNRTAVTLDLT